MKDDKRTLKSLKTYHRDKAVYQSWWPSPTKDSQTEAKKCLQCWRGRHTHGAWFIQKKDDINIQQSTDKKRNRPKLRYAHK